MAVFKCKMCGGEMEIANMGYGQCPYCGTTQTFPKLDDERRAQMYGRANEFRRLNEFDKALGIFEQILSEDPTDAEAYWSVLLCTYGVEYVEDPRSHIRIPTVNRAQYTSIFSNPNYAQALENADEMQRQIYVSEATTIDNIQKGILEVSSKEEPFDVFICYKETDDNGLRTQDSVYAYEIYDALKDKGYRVFFSRITLENKLGTAYEPYIFAALNSAKVMLVIGTKPENFNSVWVKNEWARYIAIMENDKSRYLIPIYKDMSPSDLPHEFAYLQAQDMSKIGFMQDIVHGVEKLIQKKAPTVILNNASEEPLLKRAFIFIEDHDWQSADAYCEKVLDLNPENAKAYLGKLLVELRVTKVEELKNLKDPFDNRINYQKAIKYDSGELHNTLVGYIDYINNRNKEEKLARESALLEDKYNYACASLDEAKLSSEFYSASALFELIIDYKDSKKKYEQALEQAEILAKEESYNLAFSLISNEATTCTEKYNNCKLAIEKLKTIPNYKDSNEILSECENKLLEYEDELKKEKEKEKAREKKIIIISIVASILIVCISLTINLVNKTSPSESSITTEVVDENEEKYNKAIEAIESGDYENAYKWLTELGDYKDSQTKLSEIEPKYKLSQYGEINIGDEITFGSYEQDNDTTNGAEPIEWIVLDKEDNRILVISKYALDTVRFSEEYVSCSWETSNLRKWLNETFINNAFTSYERVLIPEVTLTMENYTPYYFNTDQGNDTVDRIFCLTGNEIDKYFPGDESTKMAYATTYAVQCGVWQDPYYNNSVGWWTRTMGDDTYSPMAVHAGCGVQMWRVNEYYCGVRPAMWIDIS